MIGTDHDQLVTVNGIAREVDNALAGRVALSDGVKDSFELTGRDVWREHGHQQAPAFDVVAWNDGDDRRRHSVLGDGPLRERRHEHVVRQRRLRTHLGTEHERPTNGDLRDVHQMNVLVFQITQGAEELRPDTVAVRSADRDEKSGTRHRKSVEADYI